MLDTELPGSAPADSVIAAETAILGAAIQDTSAAARMFELVRTGDFWKNRHQIIAGAVEDLVSRGLPVSPVSVLNELRMLGRLGDNLDGNDLYALVERRSSSLDYDAAIVARDAERRRILFELSGALSEAARPGFDPEAGLDTIRERLDQTAARTAPGTLPTVGELLIDHLEDLEGTPGDEGSVPLPYKDLTAHIPGLRPGQLIVIGARPGVGKSVVSLDFARHSALEKKLPTLMISLEMSNAEIMNRLIAAEAKVGLGHLTGHALDDDDRERIAHVQDRIFDAPLILDDQPICTVGHVRARLRGMARTDPCRLLIIDYLGLMAAPKAESREREVAELSRSLKLLAKEFSLPVIAAHQLNRESTKRSDKRPALSDLRESGAVEQDADIVLLLHREDVHERESPRAGQLDIAVEKNRNGPRGVVTVAFQGHYARGVDMAHMPRVTTPPENRGHLHAVRD